MKQSPESLRTTSFVLIALFVFAADQISKAWIQAHMVVDSVSTPVLGRYLELTLTHNTGGAWGMLPRGNLFFVGFALCASIALVLGYIKSGRELLSGSAFALALGGAFGNLLDRVTHGYVIDFFDVRIIHWPIFNVADSAITLGIVLLMYHFVIEGRSSESNQPSSATDNGSSTVDAEL